MFNGRTSCFHHGVRFQVRGRELTAGAIFALHRMQLLAVQT